MTFKRFSALFLSTICIILLAIVITCAQFLPDFTNLPLFNADSANSEVTVANIQSNSVCFNAPKIDSGLTNDEEFGAVKSPSTTHSYLAGFGNIKSAYFDGINSTVENGDTNKTDYDANDAGAHIYTASSAEAGSQVYKASIEETDANPYGIASMKSTYTPDGDLRGLAAVNCTEPKRDFWFIGGDTHVQNTTQLQLANITDTATNVKITVWGDENTDGFSDDGSFKYQASRNIGIDAHAQSSVLLSSGAPNQRVLAVHISSLETPVAATVFAHEMDGLTPNGVAYVGQQFSNDDASKDTNRLVIPGVHIVNGDSSINSLLNLACPNASDDMDVKVVFHRADTAPDANLRSVEKTFKVKKSVVGQEDLNFLDEGVYTLEVRANISDNTKVLASVQQSMSADGGSKELAFFTPTALASAAFSAVGDREDARVQVYFECEKPAKYYATGYDEKGNYLFNTELDFTPGETKVLNRDVIKNAKFLQLMPATQDQTSKVAMNTIWSSNDAFESVAGSPIETNVQRFRIQAVQDLR